MIEIYVRSLEDFVFIDYKSNMAGNLYSEYDLKDDVYVENFKYFLKQQTEFKHIFTWED